MCSAPRHSLDSARLLGDGRRSQGVATVETSAALWAPPAPRPPAGAPPPGTKAAQKNRRGGFSGAAGRGAQRVTKGRDGRALEAADVRGTVGPRGRLAACTAPWPFQKVTGRRPRRRRQTRRLKPGGVPVELPRGVLENAGVFGVFGEPWFFGGGRCPCHSPPWGGYRGGGGDRRGAAGKANGRLAGGGRRGTPSHAALAVRYRQPWIVLVGR